MEFREHATDYFENLARRYRVSALTRYSVARDKYSIERRFTVNWVRNLQWCIVVLYRREREREGERTNRETRFRFEVAFSISPRLLLLLENVCVDVWISVLPIVPPFRLFFRDIYRSSYEILKLKIKFFKFVCLIFFSNLVRKNEKCKWSFRNIRGVHYFFTLNEKYATR